jgi:hypothetical protein
MLCGGYIPTYTSLKLQITISLQTEAAAYPTGLLKLSQNFDQNSNSFSVGKLSFTYKNITFYK